MKLFPTDYLCENILQDVSILSIRDFVQKMIYQECIVSNPSEKLLYRESTSVTSMQRKQKKTKKKKQDPYKKRQDVKYLPTVTKIST